MANQNLWGGAYASVLTKSADFTAAVAENACAYIVTAATVPVTATLYSSSGRYFDVIRVFNSSSSRNYVTIAAASGSIVGNTRLYPGQSAVLTSDGAGTWYNADQQGSSGLLTTSLSAAQIIAMYTTPVSLVPAPASGKVIIVNSIEVTMARTSTAFTGGGAVEFRYTDNSGAKVSADMSSTLITGSSGAAYASVAGVTTELTPVAAAAVIITNAAAVFAAGTGVGTVSVSYRVA